MGILEEEYHQGGNAKTQLWGVIHKACNKVPKSIDLAQELINERRKFVKRKINDKK